MAQTIEKLIVEVGAEIKDLKRKVKQINSEIGSVDKSVKKNADSWGALQKGIGVAMAVAPVIAFGKSIVNTIAEFQKMEAVLTTTLGSSSAAQTSMRMLTDFASKTPFQVKELTDSFVKLANQGFKPTRAEMGKLGDLAASTGKSFDQLAEGIIDAQTGEFERLKEFGIRASKQGDKVAFTFKGVTTEVKNTSESIRGYITDLGNAEGVSGSMAAISETLTGKFSNMEDAYDQFALSLDSNNGIVTKSVSAVVDGINELLGTITDINNSDLSWWKQIAALSQPAVKGIIDVQNAANSLVNGSKDFKTLQKNSVTALKVLKAQLKEGVITYDEYLAAGKRLTTTIKSTTSSLKEENKEVVKGNTAYSNRIASIDKVEGKTNGLKDAIDSMTTTPIDLQFKGIEQLGVTLEGQDNLMSDWFNKQIEAAEIGGEMLTGALNEVISSSFVMMGEALGEMMAGGDVINIGSAFIEQLSSIVKGIGGQLIALGTSLLAVKIALKAGIFTNPAALIGGGVALVAIGSAMKSVLSSQDAPQMANGGLAFGESLVNVGEGRGTSLTNPEVIAPLDKLKQFMQPQGMGGGNVTFEIEGSRLVGVMGRYNKQQKY